MKTKEREEFFKKTTETQKGREFWDLKNTNIILEALGNPEKELKIIHVAGTNGKGSTTAFINEIFTTAKYRTGMYTSPHLIRINERIKINNKEINDSELNKYTEKIKAIIEEKQITTASFFEIMTCIAFQYFTDQKAEWVVLETGMGGELDATNICESKVSIITSIAREHTSKLGNTIEGITKAKAGIIKQKQICIISEALPEESKEIIKEKCKEKETVYKEAKRTRREEILGLKGDFQQQNAGIAVALVEELKQKYQLRITKAQIKEALQKTEWKGRMQWIKKNIVIDSAHNPQAIEAIIPEVQNIQKAFKKTTIIFAACKEKENKKMLNHLIKELKPQLKEIILTEANTKRAESIEELEKVITEKKDITITKIKDHKKLWKILQQKQDDEFCLITGSIYLMGDIIKAKEQE
jgi:dihydrofolate synthase / folylpolyglutamate synthase